MIHCKHDTAVVILSYNGQALHQQFLPQIIEEASGLYDVILIDNASTDDTYHYVQEHFPTVQLIQHTINNGFAQGYHHGLVQIDAKYFVLLSADFEVTPHWFKPVHSLLESNKNIAAAQPKIRYQKEKAMFEYAGGAGGFMDKWAYFFCRGRIIDTLEQDSGQYDDNIETFWASGGCFFVRADLYKVFGGLDIDFFAHMEEIDLCWRFKNAGYQIAACGSSHVYHVGGSVISYGSPQKLFFNFRNSLSLIVKNERSSKLLWLLPLRLVLDGLSAAMFLMQGQPKSIWAIVRAHWSFFGQLPQLLKKRKLNKKLITSRNTIGIYKGSILMDYFLRKKKKFSDLTKITIKQI